jgi:hypothetical protein
MLLYSFFLLFWELIGNPIAKANNAKLAAFACVGALRKESQLYKKFPKHIPIE